MRGGRRCDRCGRQGHDPAPGDATCSRTFRAARELARRGLTIREAADLFGITPGSLGEELRRFPEVLDVAIARGVEDRLRRGTRKGRLADMAALAVADDGLRVIDAARSYGVSAPTVRAALKRLRREVERSVRVFMGHEQDASS